MSDQRARCACGNILECLTCTRPANDPRQQWFKDRAAAKDAVCEAAKTYATAFEKKAVPEMTYLNAVHSASAALRAAVRALRELEGK